MLELRIEEPAHPEQSLYMRIELQHLGYSEITLVLALGAECVQVSHIEVDLIIRFESSETQKDETNNTDELDNAAGEYVPSTDTRYLGQFATDRRHLHAAYPQILAEQILLVVVEIVRQLGKT